jgi:hypothetical protein
MDNIVTISKITDNIYLSGVDAINNNINKIRELGINKILSCVDKNVNYISANKQQTKVMDVHNKLMYKMPNITVLYLNYKDNKTQNLWERNTSTNNSVGISCYNLSPNEKKYIEKLLGCYKNKCMIEIAYNYIENAINNNEKILIHCVAGISRSASMLIYFFMKKYDYNYEQSYRFIKKSRAIINPNISFVQQLILYDKIRHNIFYVDIENDIINKMR